MKQLLQDLLRARVEPESWEWFEKALQATEPPVHQNTVLGFYTAASRKMGKQALALGEPEAARMQALDDKLALQLWGADDAARALLLLSLDHLPPEDFFGVAMEAYELGDSREQESWLRALCLLPGGERFLETAVDACRTNITPLFEAIACENSFPVRVFPEGSFNQLVMKTLFNGLAVDRIVGLEERLNEDLSRMSNDFVSEREAAGRSIPVDIWQVLVPCIDEGALTRVHAYLGHEDEAHRYWAAVGLGRRGDAGSLEALRERRPAEQEPRVQAAIEDALAKTA